MFLIDTIKAEVKRLRLTNEKLAGLSGVSEKTIFRMLHGNDVKHSTVEKIINALGIKITVETAPTKVVSTALIRKTKTPPVLAKLNYNMTKKVSMNDFVKTFKKAEPSWIIDKFFKEYDLQRVSEVVRHTPVGYDDIVRAYKASSFKNDKFDRLVSRLAT